jgi:septal ring factor EnvC (AmiA/AmiB activator)
MSKKKIKSLNKNLNKKFDYLEKRIADLEGQVQSQQYTLKQFIDASNANMKRMTMKGSTSVHGKQDVKVIADRIAEHLRESISSY